MIPIESVYSDFINDVCLMPDVELVRIRFEHPSVSGTLFIKNTIKKRGFSKDTIIIRHFLNVIKKYIYETHYKTIVNNDNINISELFISKKV